MLAGGCLGAVSTPTALGGATVTDDLNARVIWLALLYLELINYANQYIPYLYKPLWVGFLSLANKRLMLINAPVKH
jgi:hypothetical protein